MKLKTTYLDEMSVDRLRKDRKMFKLTFLMYLFLEGLFILVGSYYGYDAINTVLGMGNTTMLTLLLLFGALNLMNFFMIFVVWFCCESSYYKMMGCFSDIMIFLKSHTEGVDDAERKP